VGKFKLSQNRTEADREQVARMLAADPRSEVQETAAMMQALQARAG
jgi:predicted FMN-binding regulatory protein PaiB